MTPGRRRTRDLIVVAVFVLILAVLFWPSGEDDAGTEAGPDGVSELESPVPSPVTTPDLAQDDSCEPQHASDLLDRWISSFNDGDLDALAAMLPSTGAASPTSVSFPGMDQSILHVFRLHESGEMSSPADVLDYLETRHSEQGEQWRIEDVEVQRMSRRLDSDGPELDRASIQLQRSADDLPDHVVHGTIILNCFDQEILLVDLLTDQPDLSLPIPVDRFLAAVGPYGTGEMRDLRMIVSTDLREDNGSLSRWDIRRIEANSMSGAYVETVRVDTLDGERIIDYVYDGAGWYLEIRGWREMGTLTGWTTLPLEIMLTRNEPGATANILRDHLDDIPDDGSITLTGEFEIRDEMRRESALAPRAEPVEGVIEVEIQDGNLVRTRYLLVDDQGGTVHSGVPEIRWIHIRREDRYDTGLFVRPSGYSRDAQQFAPPDDLANRMTLLERIDHRDGIGERFDLEWDGETHELFVMPSRGQSHENSLGDDWPLEWERERIIIDGHLVVLGAPPSDGAPYAAVWDTGQYRYELTANPQALGDSADWGVDAVREIVEALTPADES